MKKKILIVSLCAIITIVWTSFAFANFKNSEKVIKEKIDLSETTTIEESRVKIQTQNKVKKNYTQQVGDYLDTLNVIDKENDLVNVELYQNNVMSREELVISNCDMILTINNSNGDLLSYINQKGTYEKNTLNETQIKEMAFKIFEKLEKTDGYELIHLEQFDEKIYVVKFAKKYGKYINIGELIGFSFAPQTGEIVTLSRNYIPFANNEIKLTEEQVKMIANNYLEKSVGTEMKIYLNIVMPNVGLKPILPDTRVYKEAKETRLAYVCEFNNEARTKIYIDCTTGEAIGMSRVLGGEF